MWETWQISTKLRCRPSDLLGLHGSALRYYFDRAVWLFGQTIENDLNIVESTTKNASQIGQSKQLVLDRWLGVTGATAGRYKDPGIGMKRS